MKQIILFSVLFFIHFVSYSQLRDSVLVKTPIFTVMYSETLEQPLWVKYQAIPIKKVADRKGLDFYTEKEYHTSNNGDYVANVWDKGHMAPAAHFTDSKERLKGTFTYLNSALQHERLNRGEWRLLEAEERKWADIQPLEVHIKVVFSHKPKRVEGGAAIPDGFWKTIRFTKGDSTHIYYFPNGLPGKKWREYRVK
jgi:DNA/RNA endonuclease G (NUC1)